MRQLTFLILFLFLCWNSYAQVFVELGTNDQTSTDPSRQFLPTTGANARVQFLLNETELRAQGLHAGAEIIGIQWFVVADNTPLTTTYDAYWSDDYSSNILPTTAAFATDALTLVGVNLQDTGTYTGWHTAMFTTASIWDGTDNLLLQLCRTGSTQASNDGVAFYTGNGTSLTSNNPLTVIGFNSTCTALTGDHSTGTRPYFRLIVNCAFTSSTISPTVCGNYISPSGQTYTTSGTYMDTIANSAGCDSIISINLTIQAPSSGAATLTIDNSITCVAGADGVISAAINRPRSLLISEVFLGTTDFVEITNVNNDSIDVSGYYVAASNSYSAINTANTRTWNLTGKMASGAVDFRSDASTAGVNYWGSNLFFNPNSPGWVLIFDNNDNVVDAVFWDWTSADLATFSPTINGNVVTLGNEWLGDGVDANCLNSLVRSTAADNNTLVDWSCMAATQGVNNINATAASTPISTSTWNTGATTLTINNLSAGTYTLTSIDTLGCTYLDSIVLIDATPVTATLTISSCGAYLSPNGSLYTTTGTYTDTIPSVLGCDSIITINLTTGQTPAVTINPLVCDLYTSPSGMLYTVSGLYNDTIPSALGCDSILVIDLTVNNSTRDTINPTACITYTAPSGQQYTTSGTYLDTISNQVGCDSVITINLTIVSFSTGAATLTVDSSITCVGGADAVLSATINTTNPIVISEVFLGGTDFLEITNIAGSTVDVTGYYVAASNSYTLINDVNPVTWNLTGNMVSGASDFRSDASTGGNYWGSNLFFNPNSPGWVLVFDNNDNVVDALFWGWNSTDLSTFSPTINGNVVVVGAEWLGNGVSSSCTNSIVRTTVVDNNTLVDWSCLPSSPGVNNITGTIPTATIASSSWNTGATTLTINNLAAGIYILTSVDTLGCTYLDSLVLADALPITTTSNVTSCGDYISPDGSVYTTSGTYVDTIASTAGCDSIITLNLTINTATSATINPIACGSYTSPGGLVYTTSGTYADTTANTVGCDSILTINLTINNSTTATINPTTCDTYTSPSGMVYTTSGTYTDILTNSIGCDSIITINLSVNTTTATINPTSCGNYTSPSGVVYNLSGTYTDTLINSLGCDSIITINLSINVTNAIINPIACNSYTSPSGVVYTSSGAYTDVITNSLGCDSVITINLLVTTIDTSVTLTNLVLSANATGAAYQWIDCATNLPITGMTMQTFAPAVNGTYAVVLTQNGCTDTSTCTDVTVIGVRQLDNNDNIQLYPNPTEGLVIINLPAAQETVVVQVYNATGQRVLQQTFSQQQHLRLDLQQQPTGSYWVSILLGDQQKTFLVVKK